MKKIPLLTGLLFLSTTILFAQEKLKEIQTANILAPSVVKIDGNLTEWNDSFQAYNKSTKLYYTLSNDEKYIYLAIKSTDAINNNKIAAGGITVSINTDGKKKEKEGYTLTYPVIARPVRGQQGQRGAGGGAGGPGGGGFGGGFGGGGFPGGGFGGGSPAQQASADSAMTAAAHERVINSSKEIKLFGFKDIQDSLISIYNEYGIKAALGYDAKGSFTYELALPLKALGLTPASAKEIAYNVKVNGLQMNFGGDRGGQGGPGGGDRGGAGGPGGGGGGGGGGERRCREEFG